MVRHIENMFKYEFFFSFYSDVKKDLQLCFKKTKTKNPQPVHGGQPGHLRPPWDGPNRHSWWLPPWGGRSYFSIKNIIKEVAFWE